MTNPLFQAIVAEGGKAAVQILHAEAADHGHHSGVWVEMLKQIHAIEQHGAVTDDEKKEFEDWLEQYLAHSAVANPPTGDQGEVAPKEGDAAGTETEAAPAAAAE
jgi:hypothetical protein